MHPLLGSGSIYPSTHEMETDMISTTYVTRRGKVMDIRLSREKAVERLAFLDEQERITQEIAPSDSGDTRFNYLAAAAAIRAALAKVSS